MNPGRVGQVVGEHLVQLANAAVDVDIATAAGVRTVATIDDLPESFRWTGAVPGLLFPWHSIAGDVVEQYRPDTPVVNGDGKPHKYLFPKGATNVLNVHPLMADRLGTAETLVIVEGTKQYLAAVTATKDDAKVAAVGIAGCYGWRSDGKPAPDLGRIPWSGRDVITVFDADVSSNADVWDAARRLAAELDLAGAKSVRHVILPDAGKAGLDDALAARTNEQNPTSQIFARLLASAGRLPRKPKRDADTPQLGPDGFFDMAGLMVDALYQAVREREHLAVDASGRVLLYRDGVYRSDIELVRAVVCDLLGDRYRPMHWNAWREYTVARLVSEGRRIPDEPATLLVNVANGMLDARTGELHPHDPKYLSVAQLPVEWDPSATCPVFDAWLPEVAPGQVADLLEVASALIDPGRRQPKSAFLDGPTRSGKSTLVRILQRLAGLENTAAVTLHQLCTSRFYAAELYGKLLNAASDLSASHVEDLATFKMLTGEDDIAAERKFGQPFRFRNRAVFVFSMNTIPTVGEVSGAYLERVRPFLFPHSFAGRENPALEDAMLAELPGILVRLVEAVQAFHERGGYGPGNRAIRDRFAQRSDRVRLFLAECTDGSDNGFVSSTAIYEAFETWAKSNGRQTLGRNKFSAALEGAGYVRTREGQSSTGRRGWKGLTLRPEEEWGEVDGDPLANFASSPTISSSRSTEGKEEDEEEVVSHEGKVGAELANLASTLAPTRLVEEW